MLTREQAIAALGLSPEDHADLELIRRAYQKLRRRYPESTFSERHREVLDAYDLLVGSKRVWEEMVKSDHLDLVWAAKYLVPITKELQDRLDHPLSSKEFKLKLARSILFRSETEALNDDIASMLDEAMLAEIGELDKEQIDKMSPSQILNLAKRFGLADLLDDLG